MVGPSGPCRGNEPATAATRTLYRQRCQRCHEADGTGSDSDVPDLTNGRWQATRTDLQFFVSILDGRGTAMPGFRGKLTDQEVRDLVVFVRGFAKGGGGPADFERKFRELESELTALQKQFRELSTSTQRAQARP